MKILICVNNLVLTAGVKKIISDNLDGVIIGESLSGEAIEEPDIVLFDSRAKVEQLKLEYPGAKFICFDLGMKETEMACLLFCHGIHGIISPNMDVSMFCKALHSVNSGEIWIEQTHLKALLKKGRSLPSNGGLRELSEKDKTMVRLVAEGLKNKQIADLLCLSEPTVKAHLSRIYKTLQVNNRAELVALSAESGWADR